MSRRGLALRIARLYQSYVLAPCLLVEAPRHTRLSYFGIQREDIFIDAAAAMAAECVSLDAQIDARPQLSTNVIRCVPARLENFTIDHCTILY